MGNYAYMTSDREGGFGDWDIYKFKLPEAFKPKPVTYMKGKVTLSKSKLGGLEVNILLPLSMTQKIS